MKQWPAWPRRGHRGWIGGAESRRLRRARGGQTDRPQPFSVAGDRQNLLMIRKFRAVGKPHPRTRARKPRPGNAIVLQNHQLRAFAANLGGTECDAIEFLPLVVADFFAIEDLRARPGRILGISDDVGDPHGIDRIGSGGPPAAVHHHIGIGRQHQRSAQSNQQGNAADQMRPISHRPHRPE